MSKIIYPEIKLANSQDKNIVSIETKLKSLLNISFDNVIGDSEIENFSNTVKGFINDASLVKENIIRADNNYNMLNNKILNDANLIDEITIAERNSII